MTAVTTEVPIRAKRPSHRAGRWMAGALSLSLAWGGVRAAHAAGVARHERAVMVNTSLSGLAGGKKTVMLRPGKDATNVYWRVASHHEAVDAALEIHYLVSPNTPKGSQLVVAVNGKIMGAIVVHANLPRGRFTLRLGQRAWGHGRYDIRITEMPGPIPVGTPIKSGNMWAQIDYSASQLRYKSHFLPWRHLNFGALRAVLAESSHHSMMKLRMGLYGPVTPTLMTASQEAVAGLALRGRAHLQVRVAEGAKASPLARGARSAISVVLGPASRLPAFALPATPIVGPTVLLIHNPRHPADALLVFTGQDGAQLLRAARAFALTRMVLPLGHEWIITGGRSTSRTDRGSRGVAYPGERISLRKLVGRSAHLGVPRAVIPIRFWMPGGLFASRQSNMRLWLTMAAKPRTLAGHRPVITVIANHHWISEWTLTPGVARYQTTIPFSALVAGRNRVSFHVSGGKAAIFPGSALRLPNTHRYAVLPNLALWRRTGFPLAVDGLGQHLSVWYAARRPADWSAGLTLFARLVQASRSPLPGAVATFTMPVRGNALAVGSLISLDPRWLAASPIRLGRRGMVREAAGARGHGHAWAGASRLGAGRYLLESRTPYRHGVMVTLLANRVAWLPAAASRLVMPGNWRMLRGDLAWEKAGGRYASTRIGDRFVYGRRKTGWFWVFVFSMRPWLWVAAASGVILFAAVLVWMHALRKRAQWRAEEAR